MSGKRENKRRRSRLPGLAALVCVLAVLMSPGPADAANSPVEQPAAVRTAEHAVPSPAPAQTAAAPTVTDDGARFYDNSANWDVPEHTPVDQTAEELAREDAQSSN